MLTSRRRVVLALIVACVAVANAYAGFGDDTDTFASVDSGVGSTVTINSDWTTSATDRSIAITVFPVNSSGQRGGSVGTNAFSIGRGYGSSKMQFGGLSSGNYVVTTIMVDSLGNVTASSQATFTIP